MRKFIVIHLFILTLISCQTNAQDSKSERIENIQDQIAKLVGELRKETSINYMKHFNQVEGYKQGIWIESTNGEIWFVTYDKGLKHGKMTVYSNWGRKFVEANYKNGFLIDKVIFYDTKEKLLKTYENITLNDTIVERKIEKAEGGNIYFSKEKHRYDYKAYVKKYTAEGFLYKEGYGLFDDNWIFSFFPIGEWKYPEEFQ